MNLKETKKIIKILKSDICYFKDWQDTFQLQKEAVIINLNNQILDEIRKQCESEKKIKDIRLNFYLHHGYFPDE